MKCDRQSLLLSERRIVFLVGAVQFVNILDFVMVMPLGPDFAKALGISSSKLGMIGGSYTAAAALSGLVGSFFLDRFDRRKALAVAMAGLVLGTAAGGLCVGLYSLMAARVVAGLFGGPATSLSFSIIADVIPPERRGKAMGAVMGAFSVASVLGVPAGLELARRGGWRLPFFAVAGLGLCVAASALLLLPPMKIHLQGRSDGAPPRPRLRELLSRKNVQLSYLMTAVVMISGFLLIPNISAYLQQNLGYPRERLGLLYMVGGAVSFFTTRLGGALVDRFGSTRVGTLGALLLICVLYVGFVAPVAWFPVLPFFATFMFAMGFRNVSYNTLTSKVPRTGERATFMSIQSSVQHLASAAGAFLSAHLLTESVDGKLVGLPRLAAASIVLTALVPLLLWRVERRVARPEVRSSSAQPHDSQTGINSPGPGLARPLPKG